MSVLSIDDLPIDARIRRVRGTQTKKLFSFTLNGKPYPLTGKIARLIVKATLSATAPTLYTVDLDQSAPEAPDAHQAVLDIPAVSVIGTDGVTTTFKFEIWIVQDALLWYQGPFEVWPSTGTPTP